MNYDINVAPDELARLVVQAAENAQQEGFWTGAEDIRHDAVRHLVHFLGLLLAGDDDVNAREMEIFTRVVNAVRDGETTSAELREGAMESVEITSDPDALHAFLGETPAYLRAIVAMDRERGTRNADQVVTALSGLGLAILAADGKAAEEEDSIFTTHLNHLRGELDANGVTMHWG